MRGYLEMISIINRLLVKIDRRMGGWFSIRFCFHEYAAY